MSLEHEDAPEEILRAPLPTSSTSEHPIQNTPQLSPSDLDLSFRKQVGELQSLLRDGSHQEAVETGQRLIDWTRTTALGPGYLGLAHRYAGDSQMVAKMWEESGRSYTSSIEALREGGDAWSLFLSGSLNAMVELHFYSDSLGPQSEPYAREALALRERYLGPSHALTSESVNALAHVMLNCRRLDEAERLFHRTLELDKLHEGERSTSVSDTLGDLALLSHIQGNNSKAISFSQECLSIRRETLGNDHPETLEAINNLSSIYVQSGQPDLGAALLQESMEARRSLLGPRHPDLATSLHNLAIALQHAGRIYDAEPILMEALSIRREILGDEHFLTIQSWLSFANHCHKTGKFMEAETAYERALNGVLSTRVPEDPAVSQILTSLARYYGSIGNYSAAENILRQVVPRLEAQFEADSSIPIPSSVLLAHIYVSTGRFIEAEHLYHKSLDRLDASLDRTSLTKADILDGLANSLRRQSRFDDAHTIYEESLTIRRIITGKETPGYALTLCNQASLQEMKGEIDSAEALYSQCLEIREATLGSLHPDSIGTQSALARIYNIQGDTESAWKTAYSAFDRTNQRYSAYGSYRSIDRVWSLREESSRTLDLLLSFPPQPNTLLLYDRVLKHKGSALEQKLLRRIASQESTELASLDSLYQDAIQRYSALDLSEPPSSLSAANLSIWYADNRSRREAAWADVRRIDDQIVQLSNEGKNELQLSQLSAESIASSLKPGEVLVDFMIYRRDSFTLSSTHTRTPHLVAFVTRPGVLTQRVEFGPWSPIQEHIKAWRETFNGSGRQRSAGQRQARGEQLATVLWAPLLPHLGSPRHILISPDAALSLVPWAALPAAEKDALLVDKTLTSIIPVPRLMDIRNIPSMPHPSNDSVSGGLLIVSEVDYGEPPIASKESLAIEPSPNLPDASGAKSGASAFKFGSFVRGQRPQAIWSLTPGMKVEGERIHLLYKEFSTTDMEVSLSGSAATETAFMAAAPGQRWIHLATHGYYQPQPLDLSIAGIGWQSPISANAPRTIGSPPQLRSGLVLANANHGADLGQDDGFLTAWEIASLDLTSTELVVLSACQTAEGEVAPGEGLLSLQRGLAAAGVQHSITSIWPVDDGATLVLMERFYRTLLGEGISPTLALVKAQRWLRSPAGMEALEREGALLLDTQGDVHPSLWSGWVSTGRP